jgi:hypothetical protein
MTGVLTGKQQLSLKPDTTHLYGFDLGSEQHGIIVG